ncbi:SDR family NAD(P)-dependent oxidoreductase [Actinomadura harenae]|uniref:SDR family NAD(P)-dependent oxidoreductase n=1 Tax=Actinomadura harenae TaxID=2483351 RepID=A0A3M2MB64_9ACTN|nr:SDR family NAD(P)-dependent oxidoreductase [Actinomadura harenae]RMI47024.1 SDR family NAD(P)-dependent oxidoreductase [Actinomadura harenae]
MQGKTVMVTGGTAGIGRETARGLALLGARVIIVGRNPDRARAAAAALTAATGAEVTPLIADLSSLDGLRGLAARFAEEHDRLDVLVNNAGGMTPERRLTGDGVEFTFAVNVLAPYALTCLLLPRLRAADAARVVNLTGGLPDGTIDPANLQAEKRFLGWTFAHYNQAKTALMAMSRSFAERLDGDGITVNVAYPGHAYTPGNQATPARAFPYLFRPVMPLLKLVGPLLLSDLAKSARSSVHLASSPDVAGRTALYVDARSRIATWPKGALDPEAQNAVWSLCRSLTTLTP